LKEVESLSDEQARLLVNEGMSKPTGK
jgi:hypothetical protein